jgi:FAD/FMN-containing dehydrogenase
MTNQIEKSFLRLSEQLSGRLSVPGEDRYASATATWAKQVGAMPRAVARCRTARDVQLAVRAARECDLPLSVRGGGHDWAGRALCDGIVIDLSELNGVAVDTDRRAARISGGARASEVLAVTDPLGLAAVTGSCGGVGIAGFALGGGYGPLIGRFGLGLDNLLAADIVLADGRIVTAGDEGDQELIWALRGGGGNFGVVTEMRYRLHELPGIRCGVLLFPFAEARTVLEAGAHIVAGAPDELTVQFGLVSGPDGEPAVMVVPTWSGPPEQGEARLAPFFQLGTSLVGTTEAMPCGGRLAMLDAFVVYGQRVHMETAWLPTLDSRSIDALVEAMAAAVSPGCMILTHELRGAAARVPENATAFGLRRNHVLVEILASFPDRSDPQDEPRHRRWAQATLWALGDAALPGGYPNLLTRNDPERAAKSYGGNAGRLIQAKRQYDPDNVFRSAIPLPTGRQPLAAE